MPLINPAERCEPERTPPWRPGLAAFDLEALYRFPPVFSQLAEIPRHQLGWRMSVLPFRSVGATIGCDMALGMAEEISAALSRFRSPRLIAPATFWNGAGPAADILARCRLYQLDYIIQGTIELKNDHVHVSVTLLDVVLNFEMIWTGRFQAPLDDLLSLQQRIASETVSHLDPDLFQRGPACKAPAKTKVAAAHHAVLTAIQAIYRLDRLKFLRARQILAEAIALDPDYAAAHAWMAYWSIMAVGQGWVENPAEITARAGAAAERGVALDPFDARAAAVAGHVKACLFHDVRGAIALHERAIGLNPNLPIAWALSSWSRIYDGEHGIAIRHARMAQSLSPRDPHISLVEHALMTALFFRRDLEAAEALAEIVLTRNPAHVCALNVRLAISGHLGQRKAAADCLSVLRQTEPGVCVRTIASRPPLRAADRAYYIAGLERAGVPP